MGQNNQWLKPVLAQGVAMLLLLRLKKFANGRCDTANTGGMGIG